MAMTVQEDIILVSRQPESCATKHEPYISAATCLDDKKAPKFSFLDEHYRWFFYYVPA